MQNLIKVHGHKGLSRDAETGGIVNTDRDALLSARRRRKEVLEEKNRISKLEGEVERLTALVEKLLENSEK